MSIATIDRIPDRIRAVRSRHPGRWVSGVIVLAIVAGLVYAFATSPFINYGFVAQYQFTGPILGGLELTIVYSVLAEVIGVGVGILVAVMRLSPNRLLSYASAFYIWLFRGVPILVQILLWYNIALIFPTLGIGIPFTSIGYTVSTNAVITTFVAGILALSLNEGAYMAEIVRAGILSIDKGQSEAAQAIGLSPLQAMRLVVLPQAIRVIIPPTGNDFISMLKTTSLVSAISGAELLTQAERIYSTNFRTIELLFVASIWYLALTTLASVGQHYVEKHFSRGTGMEARSTLAGRVRANLRVGRVRGGR